MHLVCEDGLWYFGVKVGMKDALSVVINGIVHLILAHAL